ncbi:hypothetical protein [Staphylococcus sp. GDY8P119P]|uniref:hypothetical protein n=1 Tax=Staphylococcus sp. GDY8P119P TaxID=2804155 RepID=UPI001AEC6B6C|nr:hypothetical protein [Staphylococcus sp. GDY8P119P]
MSSSRKVIQQLNIVMSQHYVLNHMCSEQIVLAIVETIELHGNTFLERQDI